MKSLLSLSLSVVTLGLALGASLGYYEARLPVDSSATTSPITSPESPTRLQGPSAEALETEFKFDRIERGTSMNHEFKISNTGDVPLKIVFQSHTCKCTKVEVGGEDVESRKSIDVPPGKSDIVKLEWTAKTPPGQFRHGATFSTNDPAHARIEITVAGEVVESSSVQPAELLFGTVKAGSSTEASTYLMSNLGEEVRVLHHELSDSTIAEAIEIVIAPAEKSELPNPAALSGVKVTAQLKAGKSLGPIFAWLTLETNLPKAEKLTLPVMGTVVGDISVFGPGWIPQQGILRVGSVDRRAGKKVRLNVAIRGADAPGTELAIASVEPSELKVTLGEAKSISPQLVHVPLFVEIPAGTRSMVRMSRTAEDDEGRTGDGQIVLGSTHPSTKEVRLKVRFSVE